VSKFFSFKKRSGSWRKFTKENLGVKMSPKRCLLRRGR